VYVFISRSETNNLIFGKIILVTKFAYLLLSVTNYIKFIFFVILSSVYRIHLSIILPLYWIALYLILNLFTYIICNK